MKTLILGDGFIASHLNYTIVNNKQYEDKRVYADDQDICRWLNNNKPDCIINCIGYGGIKNIDDCETNKYKTIQSNTIIPTILATECDKLGIHFINIASGCIFDGKKIFGNAYKSVPDEKISGLFTLELSPFGDWGYTETDIANPVSFYSKTKYATDLAISTLPNVCTVRIRMPISSKNHPRNLINKLKNYNKIIDEPNSMTFTEDLSKFIDWAVKNRKTGIYNVVNPEPLTAVQVMTEYQKYDLNYKFDKISLKDLDNMTVAKRSNCILNTDKLNKEGFHMIPSKEALEKCMKQYFTQTF
jgi:dTDP-4-dehydrorhamnose reductase